jgi:hypothetical protein
MELMKTIQLITSICLFSLVVQSCDREDSESTTGNEFVGEVAWFKTLGGSSDDVINSVIETQDGAYVYFGTTKSIDGDITDKDQEENDYWIFKTDRSGNLIWSKTYGGSNDDQGQKVIQTNDGGFILVGFSMSADGDASVNAGTQDKWIIKLDANGTMLWEKSFGFSGSDQAFSVIATNDNGLLMVGFLDITASGGAGNDFSGNTTQHGVGEFWAHKLDSNGNIQWRRFFGGTNNDRAYDVVETADNGYMIVGAAESTDFDVSNPKGSYDFWIVKIDTEGTLIWEKSFGGSEIDIAYAIARSTDGNYVIVGDVRSTDGDISNAYGNADLWVIKIDANGTLLWENSFGGSGFDTARGIEASLDGGILVSGATRSSDNNISQNFGQNDFWIIKLSASGNLIWEKSFGGSGIDFSYDILQTSDNKIIAVGSTDSIDNQVENNHGSFDAWLVKLE